MATEIVEKVHDKGYRAVFFSCSPRKRVQQTFCMVKEATQKLDGTIKIYETTNDKLVDMFHGDYILPDGYEPGDRFEPFYVAWEIFWKETFENMNPDYRFGDCLEDRDGLVKYPELKGHWSSFGENYREVCIRLYSSVLEFAASSNRFGSKIMPVIMTHGGSLAIFSELENVARDIVDNNFSFETGQLMNICWGNYISRKSRKSSPYGRILNLPLDTINEPSVISKLQEEVDFLIRNKK
jgi:broad specificity phosphatase PhoE